MKDTLTIELNLAGEDWEMQQPIRTVAQSMLDLDSLVEKAFLTIEGKSKRHGREDKRCSLFATNYRVGSFEADLLLVVGHSMAVLKAADVWELVKSGIEFAGTYMDFFSKVDNPIVKNSEGDNIIIYGNGNTINISKNTINFVSNSSKDLKSLGALLEKGEVDKIQLSATGHGKIKLDKKTGKKLNNNIAMQRIRSICSQINPHLLDTAHAITFVPFKESAKVKGNIFSFNKRTGSGNVEIMENAIIPSEVYEFEIKNFVPSNEVISAMLQRTVDLEVEGVFTRGNKYPEKLVLRSIF